MPLLGERDAEALAPLVADGDRAGVPLLEPRGLGDLERRLTVGAGLPPPGKVGAGSTKFPAFRNFKNFGASLHRLVFGQSPLASEI